MKKPFDSELQKRSNASNSQGLIAMSPRSSTKCVRNSWQRQLSSTRGVKNQSEPLKALTKACTIAR